MKQSILHVLLTMLILEGLRAQGLTVSQILERVEANQVFSSARLEGVLVVNDDWGRRETGFRSYSQGRERSLVEFTSGESLGQRILRTRGDLYIYFPDAAEVVRLQGAAMSESILDSDVSYEDLSGDRGLNQRFSGELLGSEVLDGRDCWMIRLTARERGVAYPRQEIWVDKELFVIRFAKYYALSGRLLKEFRVSEVISVAGRTLPARSVIQDKLRRNSSTEIRLTKVELDVRLPSNTFSLGNLTW